MLLAFWQGRRIWRFRGLCHPPPPGSAQELQPQMSPPVASCPPHWDPLWSPCSYLKPDEDKKSKHKTAVKKKTLNPEFNEVGVVLTKGLFSTSDLKDKKSPPWSLCEGLGWVPCGQQSLRRRRMGSPSSWFILALPLLLHRSFSMR